MPTHLTSTEPIAAAVLQILAGANPTAIADRHRIDADTLALAADAFTTAGLAAIHDPASTAWWQAGITFPTDPTSRRTSAIDLADTLDRLATEGHHDGWWFLRKPPGWRIRLHHADQSILVTTLGNLRSHGVIAGWAPGRYEPETVAFGGSAAMDVVHDLFRADTAGVIRSTNLPLGAREMSIALISALCRGAGLDQFETGDVFAKVAALRPPVPPNQRPSIERLASQVTTLITSTDVVVRNPSWSEWAGAFAVAGTRLAALNGDGRLHRGLRAILAQIVLFHWNRIGLAATTQARLAATAVHALLPGD